MLCPETGTQSQASMPEDVCSLVGYKLLNPTYRKVSLSKKSECSLHHLVAVGSLLNSHVRDGNHTSRESSEKGSMQVWNEFQFS